MYSLQKNVLALHTIGEIGRWFSVQYAHILIKNGC